MNTATFCDWWEGSSSSNGVLRSSGGGSSYMNGRGFSSLRWVDCSGRPFSSTCQRASQSERSWAKFCIMYWTVARPHWSFSIDDWHLINVLCTSLFFFVWCSSSSEANVKHLKTSVPTGGSRDTILTSCSSARTVLSPSNRFLWARQGNFYLYKPFLQTVVYTTSSDLWPLIIITVFPFLWKAQVNLVRSSCGGLREPDSVNSHVRAVNHPQFIAMFQEKSIHEVGVMNLKHWLFVKENEWIFSSTLAVATSRNTEVDWYPLSEAPFKTKTQGNNDKYELLCLIFHKSCS